MTRKRRRRKREKGGKREETMQEERCKGKEKRREHKNKHRTALTQLFFSSNSRVLASCVLLIFSSLCFTCSVDPIDSHKLTYTYAPMTHTHTHTHTHTQKQLASQGRTGVKVKVDRIHAPDDSFSWSAIVCHKNKIEEETGKCERMKENTRIRVIGHLEGMKESKSNQMKARRIGRKVLPKGPLVGLYCGILFLVATAAG